jgi:3-deoxy-D-manno-octulosonic-acid transferase
VREGLDGRKTLFNTLEEKIGGLEGSKKLVWIHSSSLGEFEQAKPIIEKIKNDFNANVLVTFFSPSGYKNSIKYPYADIVSYLPFDSNRNVKKFTDIVSPGLVIFMRYDIWPNLLKHLSGKGIPMFLVDATMRKSSDRKLPVVKQFHTTLFNYFTKILTVSEKDLINFRDFQIDDSMLRAVGDTRFDRVYKKSLQAKERKLFADNFFKSKKVFVFGSSWESDEEVVIPAFLKLLKYNPGVIMIIAPHEPSELKLEKLEHLFAGNAKTIRFSFLNNYKDENIIIVDSIGILLTLYFYADITYVGGSFKQGIHNVLEPAVYGPPVLFGPKIENSQEAIYLSKDNGGILVRNKRQAYKNLRYLLQNEKVRIETGNKAKSYVMENIGATDKIISEISRYIQN